MPRPGGWRWLALALCALAGAGLNVYRSVWWHSGAAPQALGFCAPAELRHRSEQLYAPGICRIEIPESRWRPMDVTIWLRASAPLPETAALIGSAAGRTVHVEGADDPAMTVEVGDDWRPYTVTVTSPAKPQAPLAIVLRVAQPPITNPVTAYVIAAPEVGRVDASPRLTVGNLALPAVSGAVFGIIAALLMLPTRGAPLTSSPAPYSTMQVLVMFAIVVVYLGVWAVVRPPFQTPDEVQHQMRTTSVLRDPWVAQPGYWTVDPRFTNPLAFWTPAMLDKLFFNPVNKLSRGDVTALKQVAWPEVSIRTPSEPYERAIASYPTLYYLTLFAIAEPVTRLFALTPYDASYAYRFVSLLLAAACWTLVLLQLRRLPATRESATAIGALLVLNPMTAFMCSAVNVDAVNIPLAVLSSLLFWRLLTAGEGQWWTLAALVATSWTKPSGLQLIGALFVATLVVWPVAACPTMRVKSALLTLARAAVVSWATFYAWSPPRFLGGQPTYDTLGTYLAFRWTNALTVWIMYWGRLGWLEYTADPIWYLLLLALVAIGTACAAWRPRGSLTFMLFVATMLAAFVAATLAGEFLYLPLSGYVLQGRHLLPASLGLAFLVMHHVRPARIALLAMIVLLNVLLLQATIDRYYNGQWKVATYALPFTR